MRRYESSPDEFRTIVKGVPDLFGGYPFDVYHPCDICQASGGSVSVP